MILPADTKSKISPSPTPRLFIVLQWKERGGNRQVGPRLDVKFPVCGAPPGVSSASVHFLCGGSRTKVSSFVVFFSLSEAGSRLSHSGGGGRRKKRYAGR